MKKIFLGLTAVLAIQSSSVYAGVGMGAFGGSLFESLPVKGQYLSIQSTHHLHSSLKSGYQKKETVSIKKAQAAEISKVTTNSAISAVLHANVPGQGSAGFKFVSFNSKSIPRAGYATSHKQVGYPAQNSPKSAAPLVDNEPYGCPGHLQRAATPVSVLTGSFTEKAIKPSDDQGGFVVFGSENPAPAAVVSTYLVSADVAAVQNCLILQQTHISEGSTALRGKSTGIAPINTLSGNEGCLLSKRLHSQSGSRLLQLVKTKSLLHKQYILLRKGQALNRGGCTGFIAGLFKTKVIEAEHPFSRYSPGLYRYWGGGKNVHIDPVRNEHPGRPMDSVSQVSSSNHLFTSLVPSANKISYYGTGNACFNRSACFIAAEGHKSV